MTIRIFGSGCKSCHMLHQNVLTAVSNLDMDARVEYITDMEQIIAAGILRLPALLADDRVLSVGRVPKTSEIEKLLGGMKP